MYDPEGWWVPCGRLSGGSVCAGVGVNTRKNNRADPQHGNKSKVCTGHPSAVSWTDALPWAIQCTWNVYLASMDLAESTWGHGEIGVVPEL